MNCGAILACRMNSTRLKGKTLANVCGRPLLSYAIERLSSLKSQNIKIVVATSNEFHDDPIVQFCRDQKVSCYRGSLNDVASRLLNCARIFKLNYFARVNGDSPFVDPQLLSGAFKAIDQSQHDFVTNLSPRSYPYGIAAEVIRTEWLQSLRESNPLLVDAEHVTSRFYKNLDQINYLNLSRSDQSHVETRLTVDTANDLTWFRSFVAQTQTAWCDVSFDEAANHRQALHRRAA